MTVALVAAWPFFSVAAAAQKPPPDFEKLRHAFAAAVKAKDIPGIAKLSHFPLAVDVYGSKPQVTEQEFTRDRQYLDSWFFGGDATLAKCLASQAPALQDGKGFGAGAWLSDCNGNEYYFAPRGGRWAFVAYQNINE